MIYIRGRVSVTDDKHLLFLSVPYDVGWKAKIDGQETDIIPFLNDAFMAVELPDVGKYEIELSYIAPGSKVGIIVTILSLLVCILLVLFERKVFTWDQNKKLKTEQCL